MAWEVSRRHDFLSSHESYSAASSPPRSAACWGMQTGCRARFIEAAVAEGFPRNPDYNNGNQEGFGYFQATQKNGRRWSAARAFLDPARRRPNLRIETEALATGVLLDGKRAVGVAYGNAERRGRRVAAAR